MSAASFDDTFRSSFGRLVALGVSMTGSIDIARDLAQETMARAHDRWDVVGSYEQPEAWLRRVMSNLLIDEHRKRRSERAAVDRLRSTADPARETSTPESSLAWHELMEPLTDRQRLVATLFYADDLAIDEIARTLEVAPGTVKSTLAKARRRLERRLGGDSHDELEVERHER